MQIAVIGTGYVGLVSGTCFSEFGFSVTCVDKDAGKIERLKQGIIPIYEPGLDALVAKNAKAGRLTFTTALADAVKEADIVFIAVGTPSRRGDGHADLSYIYAAAEEIGKSISNYTLVVTKSTVPVGTGEQVAAIIRDANPAANFDIASNPEFLREGSAIEDFMRPDRIIAGVESERAKEIINELYRPLFLNETPVRFTSIRTAELIKYASNSFLATKIAFINEMADLCDALGADVQDVAKGIGLDKRIGPKFLHPGPGYGGSCFPKDTLALIKTAQDAKAPCSIVETVAASNEARKLHMVEKITRAMGGSVKGKTIAALGLTFKPNTDDMRDSASLVILPALIQAGAAIRTYDPQGMEEAKKLLPAQTHWCVDAYDAMQGADAIVILTEWNEFRKLDMERARGLLNAPLIIDLRNIYDLQEMEGSGFSYVSIGRRQVG